MLNYFESEAVLARVERLREEKGLSLYALAKKACVSQSTIRKWKNQKSSPTLYLLESISLALGVTVINLLADDEELLYLPKEHSKLFAKWITLNKEQQNALITLINSINN